MANPKAEMTFLEHLEELRWRLIKSAIAVIVCAIPCGVFWPRIFDVIMVHPLRFADPKPRLIVTSPVEAMMFSIKIGIAGGLIIAAPVVFWQAWRFVAPGLYRNEKRVILPAVAASTLCFLLGVGFCYVLLPYMLGFLTSFTQGRMEAMYRLNEYLTFVLQLTLSFGFVFELPVLSFVLTRFGVVTAKFLIDKFRYAFLVILVIAAVLSPPDVLSQLVITAPLVLLYGISILVSWLARRKDKR